ncbi:MAG: hypothetical protein D8M58_18285 [Calditrichaeota bacterium]|nr:MAG: hypothetical protein DWQ03_11515 [Calditrichota bacterium]MBL1207359.1 hypothetical protein [Calditrichota bacterium]NOG47191.1 hypothetical protein [Calditrichota bacterium]
MKKISALDRILFLLTGHVAGYQIIKGMESFDVLTTFYFTVSFGILVLACLLLLLFGFEVLSNKAVSLIATVIPLSLSLGLVNHLFADFHVHFLFVVIIIYIVFFMARFFASSQLASLILAFVHGIAGLVLFILPIIMIIQGNSNLQFILVSLGSMFIGIEGMLLAFAKSDKSIVNEKKIFAIFPIVLLLATVSFVGGLAVY